MLSDPETMLVMFPIYASVSQQSTRVGCIASYLGEEGALVVGKLDLGDVEELELPLVAR